MAVVSVCSVCVLWPAYVNCTMDREPLLEWEEHIICRRDVAEDVLQQCFTHSLVQRTQPVLRRNTVWNVRSTLSFLHWLDCVRLLTCHRCFTEPIFHKCITEQWVRLILPSPCLRSILKTAEELHKWAKSTCGRSSCTASLNAPARPAPGSV